MGARARARARVRVRVRVRVRDRDQLLALLLPRALLLAARRAQPRLALLRRLGRLGALPT